VGLESKALAGDSVEGFDRQEPRGGVVASEHANQVRHGLTVLSSARTNDGGVARRRLGGVEARFESGTTRVKDQEEACARANQNADTGLCTSLRSSPRFAEALIEHELSIRRSTQHRE
jgi:hypothetical protein